MSRMTSTGKCPVCEKLTAYPEGHRVEACDWCEDCRKNAERLINAEYDYGLKDSGRAFRALLARNKELREYIRYL